jgi:hypothetical protein
MSMKRRSENSTAEQIIPTFLAGRLSIALRVNNLERQIHECRDDLFLHVFENAAAKD